jgi:hypothetical protein
MLINGMNVYPLSEYSNGLHGYFMDKDGSIYSNKVWGDLKKLKGSRTPSGQYYLLGSKNISGAYLYNTVKSRSDFKRHALYHPVILPNGTAPVVSVADGIKERGWVIATVAEVDGDMTLVFSTKPVIHLTREKANAELERLAALKPGTTFVKLRIDGGRVMGGMQVL